LVVLTGLRALPLDPSLDGTRTGSKAGFDCTLPFGQQASKIPEPPKSEGGVHFGSLEEALRSGPKTFADLMAALKSRDGREIVRSLESMAGGVSREDDGRWRIGKA